MYLKPSISFSQMQSIKMPTDIGIDDSGTKDFTNVKGQFQFHFFFREIVNSF